MKTVNIKKELNVVKLNAEELSVGQFVPKKDIPNFEYDVTVTKIHYSKIVDNFTIYVIDAIII